MDELIAAIVAAPDDDAARLVWADREGGERGELVVVQCRLASGEGTREQLRALAARERELLTRMEPWPGRVRVTWRRGFVEAIEVGIEDLGVFGREWFARAPTVNELRITDFVRPVNAFQGPSAREQWSADAARVQAALGNLPPWRVTTVRTSAAMYEDGDYSYPSDVYHWGDGALEVLGACESLRGLEVIEISDAHLSAPSLARFTAWPRLRRVGICGDMVGEERDRYMPTLTGADYGRLLAMVPSLMHLAAWSSDLNHGSLDALLAAPECARLTGLDLFGNALTAADLVRLARTPALSGLRSLGLVIDAQNVDGVEALVGSQSLRQVTSLDLYGAPPAVGPRIASALGVRTLRVGILTREDVETLATLPHLDALYYAALDEDAVDLLRRSIPVVALASSR